MAILGLDQSIKGSALHACVISKTQKGFRILGLLRCSGWTCTPFKNHWLFSSSCEIVEVESYVAEL